MGIIVPFDEQPFETLRAAAINGQGCGGKSGVEGFSPLFISRWPCWALFDSGPLRCGSRPTGHGLFCEKEKGDD